MTWQQNYYHFTVYKFKKGIKQAAKLLMQIIRHKRINNIIVIVWQNKKMSLFLYMCDVEIEIGS